MFIGKVVMFWHLAGMDLTELEVWEPRRLFENGQHLTRREEVLHLFLGDAASQLRPLFLLEFLYALFE